MKGKKVRMGRWVEEKSGRERSGGKGEGGEDRKGKRLGVNSLWGWKERLGERKRR